VAGGVFNDEFNPVRHAQVVTTTTHKTLRGPRGGMVMCTKEFAPHVDKGCPLVLGGPLPHVMAAKGVAFAEANRPEFKDYARQIVANAQALAEACRAEGMTVATGGTDNHLMLIDVRPFGLTGRQAESAVRACGITLNRNSLPFDPNGPWYTSGLRLGTPAVTTLGMKVDDMKEIAAVLRQVLGGTKPEKIQKAGEPDSLSRAKYVTDPAAAKNARERVGRLLGRFPVYPQIDLALLQRHFS